MKLLEHWPTINMVLKGSLLFGMLTAGIQPTIALKFALCPKSIGNPFFYDARDGCVERASNVSMLYGDMQVECIFVGPDKEYPDGIKQAEMVMELIEEGIDGLSVSVLNAETMRPVIQEALRRNIPVVTFDSDDPDSGRATYIGTDNYFFGQRLGKVLKQLHPIGGTFAIVTFDSPNLIERVAGVRASLQEEGDTWVEATTSPLNMQGNETFAIDLMRRLCQDLGDELTGIVSVLGGPMFVVSDMWVRLVEEFPNVLFVVADGLRVQLDLLARNKVGGLVAQLPYDMGVITVDALMQLVLPQAGTSEEDLPDFIGTNVLEHVRIPLVLPELIVDQNYLGNLRLLGFTLYGIVFFSAIGFACWTWQNRNVRVVKVAQPGFLCMVAIGVIVMGAAIIPLGFDDSSNQYTPRRGQIICMSPVWLIFSGFTITFSALFAKMWRINRMFQSSESFTRVKVSALDVSTPFIILFTLNFATLLTWTLVDPLRFERLNLAGTDGWNRVLATHGTCVMNNPWPYVTITVILNFGVLVIANIQAYAARGIQSEFSESKYVAIVVVCMLQACLIGLPLLFLVKEIPQAWYITLTFIIFIICMLVLLLIFVPKITLAYAYAAMNKRRKRKFLNRFIQAPKRTSQNEITEPPKVIRKDANERVPSSFASIEQSGLRTYSVPLEGIQEDREVESSEVWCEAYVEEGSTKSDIRDCTTMPYPGVVWKSRRENHQMSGTNPMEAVFRDALNEPPIPEGTDGNENQ